MAKWYGAIGYAETVETEPGLYTSEITERNYYGNVVRNSRRIQNAGKVDDDINISNQISIVADPYAIQHFGSMRYAMFCGTAWRVTDIEVQYPRLLLTLGGVYNGPKG